LGTARHLVAQPRKHNSLIETHGACSWLVIDVGRCPKFRPAGVQLGTLRASKGYAEESGEDHGTADLARGGPTSGTPCSAASEILSEHVVLSSIMAAPLPTEGPLTPEELQLAARNKGMPLEALRYDTTPVGMHYLLVLFDI